MGSSESKEESDDGCIGNQRIRTVVLSWLLIAFFVLGCPFFEAHYSGYKEKSTPDWEDIWGLIFVSSIINICAAAGVFIFNLCPICSGFLGKLSGGILSVGGILYLAGWCWYIYEDSDRTINGLRWKVYSDKIKMQIQAYWACLFGEALLPGGAAIFLGLDAISNCFEREHFRLASNLGLILVVSAVCMVTFYMQICDVDTMDCRYDQDLEGQGAIGTGYLILCITCLTYVVLYICTCCTCNCKDACLVRVVLAIALVVGGVIASIGYYVYSGGYENADFDGLNGKYVCYLIGYTVLIGGFPIVWALDIALDDVKNNANRERYH